MNTLNLGHKAETENPFTKPESYPALLFKGKSMVDKFSQSILTSKDEDSNSSEETDMLIDEVAIAKD